MSSSISSLGLGSNVLTSDVIDQLREADEERIIKPLDTKLELQDQKDEALTLLDTLMTTFKTSVSSLSFGALYENRTVDIPSGDLQVTAENGSDLGSFTLETVKLAQQDIQQSGALESRTENIANGSGTMHLSIGTTDPIEFDIDYTATTTLEELAQAINDEAGDQMTASILQTGDDSYSLILTSDGSGSEQAITISDSGGLVAALSTTGFTNVLEAQDAEFNYNGINITRSSNTVNDLINGVTLELKTEGETANVTIKQDQEAVATEMTLLVESYNTLAVNLHDMTVADRETGALGVFNSDNFVKSITRELNSVLTSISSGNDSLVNYGIDIDRNGVMSFDTSTFESKIKADPEALELFFKGGYIEETEETKTGIFETLNDKIKQFTGFNGLIDNFESNMDNQRESLSDQRTRQIAMLDTRYEIMAKRFTAYDAIISKINTQFSSLNQIIQAEANGN